MATARHRLSPSGPFFEGSGDGSTVNLYSVDTDGTVQTDPEASLVVQTWTVPVGAGGDYLIDWYCEVTSNADTSTDPVAIGTVSLEADAVAVSEVTLNQIGAGSPWFQASGFAVRTLAAGDVVNLIVGPAAFEAGQLSARRRRITATPVTVIT